jgi:hypothetical protein
MGAEATFVQHVHDLTVADAAVVTRYHETMRVRIPSCRRRIEHVGGIEKCWLRSADCGPSTWRLTTMPLEPEPTPRPEMTPWKASR